MRGCYISTEHDQVIFSSLQEKRAQADAVLKNVVEVHNSAKELFLLAEEIDPNFSDFLQPVLELRHSLEHIIRGTGHRLIEGDSTEADIDYMKRTYEKALGHEYRAFFDSADWLSVSYREKIIKMLSSFDPGCIKEVLPNWYTDQRSRVDVICKEIADIRGGKDISRGKDSISEIHEYQKILEELGSIYEDVANHMSSLVDIQKAKDAEKRSLQSSRRIGYGMAILIAISTAVVTAIVTWLFSK